MASLAIVESEIAFPEWRRELIAILDELASGCLAPSRTPVGSSFQESAMFLLDDARVQEADKAVGQFLRSPAEANLLEGIVKPLSRVLDEVGWQATDDEYVRARSWPALVGAARKISDGLKESDPSQGRIPPR